MPQGTPQSAAPDTLPVDFFDKQATAPDTLPADFFEPKAPPQASFLSRILSRVATPVATATPSTNRYEAVPGSDSPEAQAKRVEQMYATAGEYVPEKAVPALAVANKVAQAPVRMGEAGGRAGKEIAQGTMARILQPIAAPELAAKQPTVTNEEMEKRFPISMA